MSEIVTFTTPLSQASVRMDRVIIDFEHQLVTVLWLGPNNEPGHATYSTPPLTVGGVAGNTLITKLNTGTFTTTSLVKTLFQQLQADKWLPAGAITGKPT